MTPEGQLPPAAAALVRAELRSGERMTWAGQPLPGRFARKAILPMLFAIPFTAFAIFWISAATAGTSHVRSYGGGDGFAHAFNFFPLFGLPFLLVGLGMLTSPYWMYRRARRVVYALTDQRAIIFDAGFWNRTTVRSFDPQSLHDLRRNQGGDGSGDLVFDREWGARTRNGQQATDIGFLAIPDVKRVEDLVRTLANKNPGPAA